MSAEIWRADNVNLPPSATLTILVGGWLVGVYSAVKDLKALKSAAPPSAQDKSAG